MNKKEMLSNLKSKHKEMQKMYLELEKAKEEIDKKWDEEKIKKYSEITEKILSKGKEMEEIITKFCLISSAKINCN